MKNLLALTIFIIWMSCKQKESAPMTTANTSAKEDWVELINGKDFTGWTASEHDSTWTIVDGMFQAVGKRSHLFYIGEQLKDSFKNFELDVMVRTYPLANSGIYFHTQYQEEGWPSKGMEIQVNNTHIGEGEYVELKKMASLYGTRNLYKSFGKDSVWMNVKAKVENNRVQVWLDGMKTVDYVQAEPLPAGVKGLNKGTFCLQGHDVLSKMQYKSFKVKRLPDDAHADVTAPVYGAWWDSLSVLQGKQFGFVDLNPSADLTVADLTDYTYKTGINAAWIKPAEQAAGLAAAKGFPLFTGIKVHASEVKDFSANDVDYVLGESKDVTEASALLTSGKINVWSHTGEALNAKNSSKLIALAVKNKIAIEINNETKKPILEVIKLAKEKGCRFSFTGMIPAHKMDASMYVVDAIKAANLNYKDLYIPNGAHSK